MRDQLDPSRTGLRSALEILCAKPTDVLIADIDMPELDGLTTPAGMGVLEEARLSPPSPLTTRSSF